MKPNDTRDKVQQGLDEARKMAQSHGYWVSQIYDGDLIQGRLFYASMEFIPGVILRHYLPTADLLGRWSIASLYVRAIEATTTPTMAHGDAHLGNVIVQPPSHGRSIVSRLKLIDFGTSRFLGAGDWRKRHWREVHKTFVKILRPFQGFRGELLEHHEPQEADIRKRMRNYKMVLDRITNELPWPESDLINAASRSPAWRRRE